MLKKYFFALFLSLIAVLLYATVEVFFLAQTTPENHKQFSVIESPERQLAKIDKKHPLLDIYILAKSDPTKASLSLSSWQENKPSPEFIEQIYSQKIARRIAIYSFDDDLKKQAEQKLASLANQHHTKWLKAWLLHIEAKSKIRQNNLDDAMALISKALDIAEQDNIEFLLYDFYLTAGVIFNAANQLSKAQQAFIQGLAIANKRDDYYLKSLYNNNLGLLYVHLEQWQNALSHLDKAEALLEKRKTQDLNFFIIILFNQSFAHTQARQHQLAWQKHQSAIQLLEQGGDDYTRIVSLKNLTRLYFAEKEFTKAAETAKQCISHTSIDKYKKQHAICAFEQAKALFQLKHIDKAEQSLLISIEMFKEIKHERFLTKSLLLNAQLKEFTGDTDKAFKLYKQYYSNERAFLFEDLRLLGNAIQLQKVTQERDLLSSQNTLALLTKQVDDQKVKMLWLWLIAIAFAMTWIIWHFYKMKEDNQRLYQLSYKDPLTKASNRRHYQQELDTPRILNSQLHYRLVVVDLDHFKKVNDLYGHDKGDKVLKATAQVLMSKIDNDELFVRWGGEEFLMVLKERDHFDAYMNSLVDMVASHPIDIGDKQINVTASLGCSNPATITELKSSDSAFKLADNCLYQAKRNGRNRAVMPL
ncbi:tetratricopeptide repeat-containing diguanylate cyclase [Pseudoalteromonas phenolica]|uniref:diguanylate cyclase n=2 Tax=Pseudoalteromonas phenolica TaxID=161398 RepID=A0A0S2K301_9GAMM|nr:GGDEF domain-containing protein [Pseudoalteromonas phenolica]ALO42716.1 Diguanylate cyclase [Pseudoalteromonas phenolica]MBE0356176.1 hypothetical protein [Pseudoalteromonas phenolica O-BC30]